MTRSCKKKLLQCYLNVIVISVGAMAILCGASTGLPLLSRYITRYMKHQLKQAFVSSFGQDFLHSIILVLVVLLVAGWIV